MTKSTTKWMALGLVAALGMTSGAVAQDAEEKTVGTVTVDAASAYVFRGVTLNKGLVLQPGLEVEALPGLTLGVWGNLDLDDNDGALKDGQFSEVDLYASYAYAFEGVTLSLGYAEYLYPGAEADADREVNLSIELPLPVALTLTANYGLGGAVKKSTYLEVAVGHDIELGEDVTLSLGATIGYAIPDEGDSGFSHYTVSASLGFLKHFSVSATYIGQIDDAVLADEDYVREFVASLSFRFPF